MTTGALIENVGVEATGHQIASDLARWALAVAGAEQAERVVRIQVRVGPDTRLLAEDLAHALQLVTRNTIAEGAAVEVRETEQRGAAIESIGLE